MSPAAARGIAFEWFLRGFEESGFSFHGEVPNLPKNKPLRRMLSRRFTKLYADRHKR